MITSKRSHDYYQRNNKHFTIQDLEEVGQSFCKSLLVYYDLAEQISTIQNKTIETLTGEGVQQSETPSSKIKGGKTLFKLGDFSRKHFLDELYSSKENIAIGLQEDEGSDSSPSEDDLEEEELKALLPTLKKPALKNKISKKVPNQTDHVIKKPKSGPKAVSGASPGTLENLSFRNSVKKPTIKVFESKPTPKKIQNSTKANTNNSHFIEPADISGFLSDPVETKQDLDLNTKQIDNEKKDTSMQIMLDKPSPLNPPRKKSFNPPDKPNYFNPNEIISPALLRQQHLKNLEKIYKKQDLNMKLTLRLYGRLGHFNRFGNLKEGPLIGMGDEHLQKENEDYPRSHLRHLSIEGQDYTRNRVKIMKPLNLEPIESGDPGREHSFPLMNTTNKSNFPVLSILDISNSNLPNEVQRKKLKLEEMVRYLRNLRRNDLDEKGNVQSQITENKRLDRGNFSVPPERESSISQQMKRHADKSESPRRSQKMTFDNESFNNQSRNENTKRSRIVSNEKKRDGESQKKIPKEDAQELPKIEHYRVNAFATTKKVPPFRRGES